MECELDYRLIKELCAFNENCIAARFAYGWRDDCGHWFRSYGNENWEFDENGLMRVRIASINDLPIEESERKYHPRSGSLIGCARMNLAHCQGHDAREAQCARSPPWWATVG
jgi:nuclear transport factor 2 (NTF2) superfamily protein